LRDDCGMVTGYGGTYRGAVVDDADPLQSNRLGVIVPDVYGDGVSVWAAALQGSSSLPAVGDMVLVSFEHGDTDYPIWEPYSDAEQNGDATSGYVGKYRASVVDNADPMQENRLQVTVPEVDSSSIWATASDEVRYGDTPEIGAEVWIEYEYGDPAYPRWVGLA
jgi:Type VI secretion system/phage-baseplate injector OB domain